MKKVKTLFIVFAFLSALVLASCSSTCEHKYELYKVNIVGTCTTDGEVVNKCTKCGDEKVEAVIAEGHKVVEANCLYVKHCSECFEEYGTTLGDHIYGEAEITKAPTCEDSGVNSQTCTICNKVKSTYVPALGHDYTEWEVKLEGICLYDGFRERVCNTCSKIERETIKGDHVYLNWEIKEEATCMSDGSEKAQCIYCDNIIVRTIPLGSHSWGDTIELQEATCSSFGLIKHECSVCHIVEEELVEKLEHNYEIINDSLVCSNCHNSSEKYEEFKKAFDDLELVAVDTDGIVLPSVINSTEVIWKSYTPDIALDDGSVYAKAKGQTAIYKATVVIDGNVCEFMEEVYIPKLDTSAIDWCWSTYYGKKVPMETANNIAYLWKNYASNTCSVVGYESSNPSVIDDKGVIHQEVYDQYATITCHLKIGKVIGSYSREVKVLGYTDNQRLELVIDWLPTVIDQLQNNEIDTLPLTHEVYGTTISWFCMESGIIAGNGVFVKPMEEQDLTLNVTISSGIYSRDLEYQLESIGGNTNEFEQLRDWIKGQIPSRIMGTRNYVFENDSFDYQIRTNDRGVLNLIDGTNPLIDRSMLIDINKSGWVNHFWGSRTFNTSLHPSVPQSILDKMLYTGYQNPNPQNILWITVHESGMPRSGNDALLLAKVQMESAQGIRDREASWNYQVDENVIYQSFEDEVICWHAGDGTATLGNGNNNSIGIEMCINEDGNYDGAMHMDAKLIAMLLHKYNLNLENVKRHYDWSGKICPNYMIVTGRWNEFLNLVDKEYTAMKLLKDAKVSWTVTTDDNQNTEEVLNTYFTKGGSTLWFSKKVTQKVTLHITMTVELKGEVFTHSNDLTLYPNA